MQKEKNCKDEILKTFLAQLLVEVGAVALGRLVRVLVVQVEVPGEEHGAEELLELQGHVQADGDDVVEEDKVGQRVLFFKSR